MEKAEVMPDVGNKAVDGARSGVVGEAGPGCGRQVGGGLEAGDGAFGGARGDWFRGDQPGLSAACGGSGDPTRN